MPELLREPAIAELAGLLCRFRAAAMALPQHVDGLGKLVPCDVCRRQAVLMLDDRWKLVRVVSHPERIKGETWRSYLKGKGGD